MSDKPDTKTDRIIRAFLDHPVYAWLVVAALALAGAGQAAGGFSSLATLFKSDVPASGKSESPTTVGGPRDGDVRLLMTKVGGDSFQIVFPITINNTDSRALFITSFELLMKLPVASADPDTPWVFCNMASELRQQPKLPLGVQGGMIVPFQLAIDQEFRRCDDEDPKEFEAEGIKLVIPEGDEFFIVIEAVDWNGRSVSSLTKLATISKEGTSTSRDALASLLLETVPEGMHYRTPYIEQ